MSWDRTPVSTLFGTNHQVALRFTEESEIFGSLEPPTLAVAPVDADLVIVHSQSYSDQISDFSLDSPDAEAAQSFAALLPW